MVWKLKVKRVGNKPGIIVVEVPDPTKQDSPEYVLSLGWGLLDHNEWCWQVYKRGVFAHWWDIAVQGDGYMPLYQAIAQGEKALRELTGQVVILLSQDADEYDSVMAQWDRQLAENRRINTEASNA